MNEPILKLTFTNATPLLIGWHDPYAQDPMGIRVTEIKGVWRWWCRAFIAGAMFDQGMLCGRPDKNVLYIPRNEEAEAISCLVGKILGLGYVGRHGAEASRFRLFIEKVEGNISVTKFKNDNDLQRIRLLSLGHEIEGLNVNPQCRFVLAVEKVGRGEYMDTEDLALRILIASLQLSGIGKGGRRGLGSLDIVYMSPRLPDVKTDIKSFIEETYKLSFEIVRRYGNMCGARACKDTDNTSKELLPPIPAISSNKNIFRVFKIDARDNRDFAYVHNFFVRSKRCKQLTGKSVCIDDLRRYEKDSDGPYAWFLGLPREQKGTGYIIKSESLTRRPSPIILAYHNSTSNVFGRGIFISIFLSGDWPKKITWVGGKGSKREPVEIEMSFDRILTAYNIFVKEFNRYLSRKNLDLEPLWPQV